MSAADRRQLRRQFRQQRRALSHGQRRRAAARFGRALDSALPHRPIRHVALYLANDGELDLLPALRHQRFRATSTYLPFLDPIYRGRLRFRLWQPHHAMRANGYGIDEPAIPRRGRALWALDVIVLPAVAFDEAGFRLGMGGGYYDRTLADLTRRPRRPVLVAAGYDFQKVKEGVIPVAPWDHRVDLTVTAGSG
ncbi:MAG: 5-formyltetrahydrofolate cyclo-ligase [Pseudomonadales bacterium]|nr:5-formyltetrahydrofolate cyclo-ligase [Pseudomonadales bacterium]